jgi:hypothetical protein
MLAQVVFVISVLLSITSHALSLSLGSHNEARRASPVDPPTKLVRRQTKPSSTRKPIISVSDTNATRWAAQTNQLCMAAINITSITNPAGVVPCYNVLSFDPNTGFFLSEVRLFQIVNMEKPAIMAGASGSGLLFEFPHAEIHAGPGPETKSNRLGKRAITERQSSMGQVNVVDAFYMNGTADISQPYQPIHNEINSSLTPQQLLTPTTVTLNLNISSSITPFSMTSSLVMFVNGVFSPQFVSAPTSTT